MFQADVINRFENPDNRDVQDLFNKLSQTGTVNDYEDKFEELRALVVTKHRSLTEDYFVSSFLSGLQDHIKSAVRMFRPQTLVDAIFLAKQEESKQGKGTTHWAKPQPKTANSFSTDNKRVPSPLFTSSTAKA